MSARERSEEDGGCVGVWMGRRNQPTKHEMNSKNILSTTTSDVDDNNKRRTAHMAISIAKQVTANTINYSFKFYNC